MASRWECRECGGQGRAAEARWCPICGAQLTQMATARTGAAPSRSDRGGSWPLSVLVTLLGVVTLGAVAVGVVAGIGSTAASDDASRAEVEVLRPETIVEREVPTAEDEDPQEATTDVGQLHEVSFDAATMPLRVVCGPDRIPCIEWAITTTSGPLNPVLVPEAEILLMADRASVQAYDALSGERLWAERAVGSDEQTSRLNVWPAAGVVLESQGTQLALRDLRSGEVRWRRTLELPGEDLHVVQAWIDVDDETLDVFIAGDQLDRWVTRLDVGSGHPYAPHQQVQAAAGDERLEVLVVDGQLVAADDDAHRWSVDLSQTQLGPGLWVTLEADVVAVHGSGGTQWFDREQGTLRGVHRGAQIQFHPSGSRHVTSDGHLIIAEGTNDGRYQVTVSRFAEEVAQVFLEGFEPGTGVRLQDGWLIYRSGEDVLLDRLGGVARHRVRDAHDVLVPRSGSQIMLVSAPDRQSAIRLDDGAELWHADEASTLGPLDADGRWVVSDGTTVARLDIDPAGQ